MVNIEWGIFILLFLLSFWNPDLMADFNSNNSHFKCSRVIHGWTLLWWATWFYIMYQILFHLREDKGNSGLWLECPQGRWLRNVALVQMNNSVHGVGGREWWDLRKDLGLMGNKEQQEMRDPHTGGRQRARLWGSSYTLGPGDPCHLPPSSSLPIPLTHPSALFLKAPATTLSQTYQGLQK